ncbi:Anaerobic selenocysteine-containing dehydrogenase [Terriglobus roseus]|uniref:Anaerobic selenocysteine-containing dehydrogenase n=2 Tax=Terriglobus roseus TaxID=392734 RepID=A0A1H4MT77_9BACT|nr:Anaerobic selenocysteine-containing dehydrogenase [Terriglobus roseus]
MELRNTVWDFYNHPMPPTPTNGAGVSAFSQDEDVARPLADASAKTRVVHTTCSLDCPDSCGVLATVDTATNRVVRIAGDPAHPVTRGFLCGKVARYLDRVYSPDRLLYPMRRRAGVAKGSLQPGEEHLAFERISWDEALDAIASRLQQVSDTHGPESILPYSYAGIIGQLGYGSMDRRFFHRLGASQLDRTICASAGTAAFNAVYGVRVGPEPQSFAHAKLILAWGANLHGNSIHLWPFVEQARRNGARLVVIDPYQTKTARLADQHIAIKPGTDTALAMGMMHVILRDGLEDRDYIRDCTHGFEALRDRVMTADYSPEHVAAITGVDADVIVTLARAYATTQPAVIRVNYGIQRTDNGGTAARAVGMLPLLTGAWKYHGGGVMLSTSNAFGFNSAKLQMPELMQASPLGRDARTLNMSQLGEALTQVNDPAVHALFVYNSNPAAVAPNQSAVLRGMRRDDLFTVVHDCFFTDTADHADIVLPSPSFLEQDDVQGAYGHYVAQLSLRAMEPMGDSRSNVWLFGQLAQRMGFTEPCFQENEQDLLAQALDTQHPWHAGITLGALKQRPMMALALPRNDRGEFLPFADATWFRTPSGRGEFYSESLLEQGRDPLPGYTPTPERNDATQPLRMLPRKADHWMNSTFANIPQHRAMEAARIGLGALEIHPDDAATRGISQDHEVEVANERGSLRLRASLTNRVPRGTVAATLGWNKLSADGHGVNVLTSERLTDLGGGATFYATNVEVRLAVVKADEDQTASMQVFVAAP